MGGNEASLEEGGLAMGGKTSLEDAAAIGAQQVNGVAMVDPAAVECVLRHWTRGDSANLHHSLGGLN